MTNFGSSTAGTPAVGATGSDGADGIDVSTDSGTGVAIISQSGTAINAESESGTAVEAMSGTAFGVLAWSESTAAIYAWNGPKDVPLPVQDAAVHAFSAGTIASPGPQGFANVPTAMFAEGGVGYGLIATAAPTEAQLTSGTDSSWGGIGCAIAAQNSYGDAIDASSYFGTAVNATIVSQADATPPLPPGTTGPGPGICITAANANPERAIYATTQDTEKQPSDCIDATTFYGTGVKGSSNNGTGMSGITESGTGVMGTTTSADGIGVTADGGTISGTPIGAVALKVQNGTIAVTSDSVGTTILAHGTKTVTVPNPAATPNSLILLTPQEDPQGFLWIGARNAGSFRINASAAPSASVTIGFLIIN